MDPLDDQLLSHLEQFGYALARPDNVDPSDLLVRMVESKDARVLEGFPVVLANVLRKNTRWDLTSTESRLPVSLQRRFRLLVAFTYFFLFWVPDSEEARNSLLEYLRGRDPSLLPDVQQRLYSREPMPAGAGTRLDPARLEKTFKNYVVQEMMQEQQNLARRLDEQRQGAFLEALSVLFTERQKALVFKVLNHETLTKTEREYYSRTVKPRLRALHNADLQSMAATLLNM